MAGDDLTDEFLAAAQASLAGAALDEPPSAVEADDWATHVWRRLMQAAAEDCEAIAALQSPALHRPAHALLRVLLESIACAVWITHAPAQYAALITSGSRTGFKNVLERIGWAAEYDRTYAPLSEFIHPSEISVHAYTDIGAGSTDTPAPGILRDSELYVSERSAGVSSFSLTSMSDEEAERAYGPFVRAKAFDLAIAGLSAQFGAAAGAASWWQAKTCDRFVALLSGDPSLAAMMLSHQATLF